MARNQFLITDPGFRAERTAGVSAGKFLEQVTRLFKVAFRFVQAGERKLGLRHGVIARMPIHQIAISGDGLVGFALGIEAGGHTELCLADKGRLAEFAQVPFELLLRFGIFSFGEQVAGRQQDGARGGAGSGMVFGDFQQRIRFNPFVAAKTGRCHPGQRFGGLNLFLTLPPDDITHQNTQRERNDRTDSHLSFMFLEPCPKPIMERQLRNIRSHIGGGMFGPNLKNASLKIDAILANHPPLDSRDAKPYPPRMELDRNARIYVAGHRGLVGSAIWRELQQRSFARLIGRTHAELDLLDSAAVERFYAEQKPEYVFVAAAKVGGILANNSQPAEFLYQNLQIQNNLIHCAYGAGVKKLLFLGSSCIYPKHAPQPMKEEHLLSGHLEPTNEWYAVAKIAGIKMCQAYRRQYGCDFISAMPTNMYGPNDNYDLQTSHVLPALIRKFHEAKAGGALTVTCWGTGQPLREFLYADDLARACVFLMEHYSEEQFINVGFGSDVSVRELAETVKRIVGFDGEIAWDASKPDGTPRKLMDSSRLFALGWRPQVDLETGIGLAYEDFLSRSGNQV